MICEPIVTKPKPVVEVPKDDQKSANGDEANPSENRAQERVDDEASDKDAKSVDMELD